MKIKNRIKTNSTRTIKKTFPRFLSLITMSFLGVMVFTGLQATSPDMLKTLDNYYDKNDVYDIKIISTMGLVENDINALSKIDSVNKIEGTHSKDFLIAENDKEFVLNISSIPNIVNRIELLKGKLPSSKNELVVEENFIKDTKYKIGDTIYLEDNEIHNQELKIVGTIKSPLYFNNTEVNQTRGASTLGTGSVNYYSYMPKENFNLDYYSHIYLTVENAKEEITSKDEYKELINSITDKLNKQKTIQETERYENIKKEATEELNEKEAELKKELSDAKKELNTAKKELDSAKKELTTAEKGLTTFKKELNKAKQQLSSGQQQYKKALKQYNIEESKIDSNLKTLKENITQIENALSTIPSNSAEYTEYSNQLINLKTQYNMLNKLKETKKELENGEKEYNKNYSKYQKTYQDYQKGLTSYKKGLAEYKKGLKEYEDGKKEAEEKITEAKEEINSIEKPVWYIYNRADDQTYSSYINQTKSIKNLSAIFPVVFYGVAILVSLISMNRMVEDDRGEIGTLKSLGFTNKEIITKYILYSLLATITGGLLGILLGNTAIPYLIFYIYRMLFILPDFHMSLNISISITGLLIAIICICGATIITANKILKDNPAILMRPKPPKSGKKILLENIKPLWHHINFSKKITIRNIFRYKKRVFVTIFGITGCTALMLCGFGIKDSIVDLTELQYGKTFTYDATVYTKDLKEDEVSEIFKNESIKETIVAEQISGTLNESNLSILITKNNDELEKIINLVDSNNQKVELKNNEIAITDKLADIHDIKENDQITILDSDNITYNFKITHIVKNYMGHYIYMNEETLNQYKEFKPNIVYLKTNEISEKEKDSLSKELLDNESIINVIHTHQLKESTKDMLDSLDKIIIVLIVLAASLSFVVLYNLSNINITERKREIATLKVLGFYDKEVDNYITKENIILTVIGIAFGCVFGYFLTHLTIGTVEMENARFVRQISFQSYCYASIISCIFTYIVNFVTHFSLKKINMTESLKSVE